MDVHPYISASIFLNNQIWCKFSVNSLSLSLSLALVSTWFVCPNNCSKNHYYLLLRNPILPECLSISCSVCEQKWYVCINCHSQLKHITTHLQYKRHANLCRENYVFPTLQHKSQNKNHIKLKDFKSQLNREANALYFYFEQFNMDSAYLISNAHFKLPNVAELVTISDVNTQLKITKVLHSILSSISEEMTSIFKIYDITYHKG